MNTNIKIAVVDDHKGVRRSLKTLLEIKNFKVIIEADNGRSLLEQLNVSSEIPHLCILDVNMPEMNGFDTAKALKKDWQTIKIIGFSSDVDSKDKMLMMGADAFLSKDCEAEELYQLIKELT
ncbi:hypothetical protein A3860_17755 [Niastella vici]|uniref:Response regulatory domain-containing protein n=1 Tax=Niastella vici TaxID=1703345 RepID=A0A1V9G4L6_9BACT|nr:response regulator transcription factor [Niastella vici]OQP65510.1 hypothetical protein A3860_17755 [Niastella vici]